MASPVAFSGFSQDLLDFFQQLAKNNNKAWLDAHRREYDGLLIEPAKQFVAALAEELDSISPHIRAKPTIDGSIMRMNRDIRFSADKSPYKTALHFRFWQGTQKNTSPSFFMRFDATRLGIAAGVHGFTQEQLQAYRNAVADEQTGKALRRAIDTALAKGFELSGEHYKRVPKGFEPDHVNADLLRHNGLLVGQDMPLAEEMCSPKAAKYILKQFKQLTPLHTWLVDVLAEKL